MSGRYLNEISYHPCREFLGRNLRKTSRTAGDSVLGERIAEIGKSVSEPEGLDFVMKSGTVTKRDKKPAL
ncbi:MAG: hypothetical protein Q8S57_05625 [Methanoregula sp.]|nr:hypothetical protein [Methanoregula sp.]